MILSDEQIKQIANSIVLDVHHYMIEHQEEYEKFLSEEMQKAIKQDDPSLLKSSEQEGGIN